MWQPMIARDWPISAPCCGGQVFHMDRKAFARLPHWRQVQAKRSAGLF